MKRVLQIGMTNNLGGIENYLINYYRTIDKEKVQFDFVNIYSSKLCFSDEITEMGGKIYDVPNYYKHPLKYLKTLKRIIKDNNYEVVHCNMNSAVMLFPLIAAKLAKVKTIIAHSHNSSSDKGFLKELLHNFNKKFIPFFATDYFACSETAGKWFFNKKIINSSKFRIINNAIDTKKFSYSDFDRKLIRNELNIKEDEFVIGHVGRFNKQKNHAFLINVFSELLKIKDNSKLVLVGTGDEQKNIINMVKSLNIEDKVLFLNNRNDVNKLFSSFDIFILPSLYEGLPLVGVEAQANGVSCIFSDNITKELLLNDNVSFFSLNNSFKDWALKIIEINNSFNRRCLNSSNVLKYDICSCAFELSEFYCRKIKVCHFVNGLLDGGVEKVLLNYFSHMDNINDYELHIISQSNNYDSCMDKFLSLGFTIHNVTRKKDNLFKNLSDINRILKSEEFDIVHCHMTTTNFVPLILAKLNKVKVRISHSHLNSTNISFSGKIYRFLTKLSSQYKFACGIGAAEYLYGSSKNVYIMNNAIDINKFKFSLKNRNKIRNILKLNDDDIVIGHVGRFVEQKNHKFIIEAFNKLLKINNKYKLVLIGTGENEDYIKELVASYNLNDNVYFLESRNDVCDLYSVFDIFVLPSLYEGLPVVGVEAQTSGLKCFVSDTIHREIKVTNNIFFLPLDIDVWVDEIKKIKKYDRNDMCDDILNGGFDIVTEANNLDKVYKKLLKGNGIL